MFEPLNNAQASYFSFPGLLIFLMHTTSGCTLQFYITINCDSNSLLADYIFIHYVFNSKFRVFCGVLKYSSVMHKQPGSWWYFFSRTYICVVGRCVREHWEHRTYIYVLGRERVKHARFWDADGNRKRTFCVLGIVSQIFIPLISNGEKILSNVNVVVWRQVKSEDSSLPVTVRVSKTRMLKFPND